MALEEDCRVFESVFIPTPLPARPAPNPEPAPFVQVDVQWNRPVFKAPPLKVNPPVYRNVESFLTELARAKAVRK